MFSNRLRSRAFRTLSALALVAAFAAVAAAQDNAGQMGKSERVDKRKLTTIQTAAADYGKTKGAVEVRYLNLPWGETTFASFGVSTNTSPALRNVPPVSAGVNEASAMVMSLFAFASRGVMTKA